MDKIQIDGETLYIKELGNTDAASYVENKMCDSPNLDTLKDVLKPVVKMGKFLKEGLLETEPDEVELTLQLQLALSGNSIVFAVVNAEADAHLSLKFVWKQEDAK